MKVLFWSETFWPRIGGVERLAAALLPALRERGHEFVVVTWVDACAVSVARFADIAVHRFPFFAGDGSNGARHALEHLAQVRDIKRAFRPDVVHVNSYGRSAWFHLATGASGARTLVTLHQPLTGGCAADTIAGRLLGLASGIACCSRAVRSTLPASPASLRGKACVIDNALPAFPEPAPLACVPPILLFVGRLVAEKGLDVVLRVLPPLFARFAQAKLVVAGDGPMRVQLEAQAAALGLASRVQFLGAVPENEVCRLLREATVVVVPSRTEGFGLVALEAALSGRPVVATRAGGLPEVVRHEHTGLLCDVDDGEGLAHAVSRLLDDPGAAARMGRAALAHARHRFAWQRHVDAYDELYRRLAA